MKKKTKQQILATAWKKRLKLYAEGAKFCAEGAKLRAEGDRLWAEGDKLHAEGARLWVDAVLAEFGNIPMKYVWDPEKKAYACILTTPGGELRFDS